MEEDHATFAVIVAMPEEWKAFTELLSSGRVDDQGGYLETEIQFGSRSATIIASMCTDQGNWASYDAVSNVLALKRKVDHWFLVGVAGSLRSSQKLCDVVVSSSVYYYPHRASIGDGPEGPLISFTNQTITADVPEPLRHLQSSNRQVSHPNRLDWPIKMGALKAKYPELKLLKNVGRRVELHSGNIASGEFVCESDWLRDQILLGDRKALAVEMEGYGFARALTANQIRSFTIVRGISDHAGSDKAALDEKPTATGGKVTQRAAAWVASRTCFHLMALILDDHRVGAPHADQPAVSREVSEGRLPESARLSGLLPPNAGVEFVGRDYIMTEEFVVFLNPPFRASLSDLEALGPSPTGREVRRFIEDRGARFDRNDEQQLIPIVYRAASRLHGGPGE